MILFSAACVKFDGWFSGVCVIFMAFGSNNNNNNDRLTAFDPGQPG